ncbi:hypothetical protein AAFF_G00195590 [Aldrovandia affinis]|uniref:Galaxin-like repeats domain-containing protein n=1 Tax=Aldrovandia affinis TaxID=143900 RepID=A0AAD7RIX0_9TELE|nr:hypothetical protein AAFF_G00195590 [Aldrovandia affinis]
MSISAVIFFMVAANTGAHLASGDNLRVGVQESNLGTCAGKPYSIWKEVCCDDGTVRMAGGPNMQCCGEEVFDPRLKSCCNGTVEPEAGLSCCGSTAYSPISSTCCQGKVTTDVSEMVSDCCETEAYNPISWVCCKNRLHPRRPHIKCCDTESFNSKTQLCCGPLSSRTVIAKLSEHHSCCGTTSFDQRTEYCTSAAQKQSRPTVFPVDVSGNLQGLPSIPTNLDHQGSCDRIGDAFKSYSLDSVFNPKTERCCVNQISHSGQSYCAGMICCEGNLTSTTGLFQWKCCGAVGYDPREHICCAGQISEKWPGETQCCGVKPYSVLDPEKLCCNGVLLEDDRGLEGWECAESRPYCPTRETRCGSVTYPEPGRYCCGHEAYNPGRELCCAGHRLPLGRGKVCCGAQAYYPNSKLKCCSGHLHRLVGPSRVDAVCCGTHLIADPSREDCCASFQMQLPYPKQAGFSCCREFYYNTSQYSCCAGHLRSLGATGVRQGEQRGHCEILNLDNLKNKELCKAEAYMGTVVSIAVKAISRRVVVKKVLRISMSQKVTPLNSITLDLDHCSCPPLAEGRLYLWIKQGPSFAFSDLSPPESLVHTLLSICLRSKN